MIEKLRARGWIGIKRGTGQDDFEVDFTGREGLIAFEGTNGSGKTSVLDLLHPFDCLPSRDGSLKNHVFLRDSFKELTFALGGKHYKTLLKIDSNTGKSEGFAWVNHSEKSETKGSITEYHKWAISEFGSTELFFSSIFASQNGEDISDMTVAPLKRLFMEFLKTDRYEKWTDTAKQAGNVLSGKVGGLDSRTAALQEAIAKKDAIILAYCDAGSKAEGFRDDKTLLEMAAIEKWEAIDVLKETLSKNALALERKKDLQGQIDRREGELAKEKEVAAAEISVLGKKYRALEQEIIGCDCVLEERWEVENAAENMHMHALDATIIQNALDELAQELMGHQAQVHEIETGIAKLKADRQALVMDPETIEAEKKVADLGFKLTGARQALENLKNDKTAQVAEGRIAAAKEKMKSLDLKDPGCASSTCNFIVEAIKAQAALPALEAERNGVREELNAKETIVMASIDGFLAEMEEARDKLHGRREAVKISQETVDAEIKRAGLGLDEVKSRIKDDGEKLASKRDQITKTRAEVTLQKALADKLPEIHLAARRKVDLEEQLVEVLERGEAKKQAWIARENALKAMWQSERDKLDAIAIDPFVNDTLAAAQQEITEIETVKLPALDKEIQAARETIAILQAELLKIEAAEKELKEVGEQKESLTLNISRWGYLQNACGKNGLQALEIDGAAPLISERANKLLHMGFGPQSSIRIDTQDEEGKECLEIKILSEDGEDSLKQKSGGEKVWLLHPIRLAMTLLSKEKSGREWDYSCFDEKDDGLNVKGGAAANFMQMYRPFMEMGGLKQVFFISHKEVCFGYADHVLHFERGESPRWV